jgi:hypothetical protein
LTNGLPRLQKFNEGGLITFREQVLPSVLLRGQGKLRDVDGWLRNRLRYCIWHHWKKPERKRKNLIRLGVNPDDAYAWSRTRIALAFTNTIKK